MADHPDMIYIPRRGPGPRPITCATIKFSARILGQRQLDVWEAMRALSGRRNHQLAADIILDAIRAAEDDPDVQGMMACIRRSRRHLEAVPDDL